MSGQDRHIDSGELYALLAGELDRRDVFRIERHLKACTQCRQELDFARSARSDLAAIRNMVPAGLDKRRIRDSVLSELGGDSTRSGNGRGRRPRARKAALMSVAVAAGTLLVFWAVRIDMHGSPASPPGTMVSISPRAALQKPGSGSLHQAGAVEIKPGDLAEGVELISSRSGPGLKVSMGLKTGFVLRPGSSLVPRTVESRKVVLDLKKGTGLFKVEPGAYDYFRVDTRDAEITVKGTVFSVSRPDGASTLVRVSKGRVEVRSKHGTGSATLVDAGKEVLVTESYGGHRLMARPCKDPDLVLFTTSPLFGARDTKEATREHGDRRTVHAASGTGSKLRRKRATRPRSTQVHNEHSNRVALKGKKNNLAALEDAYVRQLLSRARNLAIQGLHGQVVEMLGPVSGRIRSMRLAADVDYVLARSLARLGRKAEALGKFEAAWRTGSPSTCQRAMYEAALLADKELKDFDKAVEILKRYLDEYPRGTFEEEARFLLCGIQAESGDKASAMESCKDYLDRFPKGYRSTRALYIAATLYRSADPEEASRLYQSYLQRKDARKKDEALYWKAGCLLQAGDKKGAVEAFDLLLKRYPGSKRVSEVKKLLQDL